MLSEDENLIENCVSYFTWVDLELSLGHDKLQYFWNSCFPIWLKMIFDLLAIY